MVLNVDHQLLNHCGRQLLLAELATSSDWLTMVVIDAPGICLSLAALRGFDSDVIIADFQLIWQQDHAAFTNELINRHTWLGCFRGHVDLRNLIEETLIAGEVLDCFKLDLGFRVEVWQELRLYSASSHCLRTHFLPLELFVILSDRVATLLHTELIQPTNLDAIDFGRLHIGQVVDALKLSLPSLWASVVVLADEASTFGLLGLSFRAHIVESRQLIHSHLFRQYRRRRRRFNLAPLLKAGLIGLCYDFLRLLGLVNSLCLLAVDVLACVTVLSWCEDIVGLDEVSQVTCPVLSWDPLWNSMTGGRPPLLVVIAPKLQREAILIYLIRAQMTVLLLLDCCIDLDPLLVPLWYLS